jgi:hypothetical protein
MFSPQQQCQRQRAERFPPDRRRAPTEADMHALRDLLMATAGDAEELARWVGCVLDTDDDAAAITAYWARVEYAAIVAAKQAEKAIELKTEMKNKAKTGPKKKRFLAIDKTIIIFAEQCQAASPVTSCIREAVHELSQLFGEKLGASEDAVVKRVFGRLRSLEFDYLPIAKRIAPRQHRGVTKFSRTHAKNIAKLNNS